MDEKLLDFVKNWPNYETPKTDMSSGNLANFATFGGGGV